MSDPEEGILIESFEFQIMLTKQQFTVLSDSQENTNELQRLFTRASQMKFADRQIVKKNSLLVQGFKQGCSKSWRMTNYVVVSLERIGEEVEKIPKSTAQLSHLGSK